MSTTGWKTHVQTGEDGGIIGVEVTDADGWRRGRWQAGYLDVTAGSLNDKDAVRRLVNWAIGDHVIRAAFVPRPRRSTPQT